MVNVADAIKTYKIITILRRVPLEQIFLVAEALYRGGIRLIEVTFDQEKKFSDEDTFSSIRRIKEAFRDDMYVGAGTVMTEAQVEMAVDAGAKFIISPNTDPMVIKRTKQLGAVSIPGALSPTEIVTAHQAGADYIKIFPAGVLGIEYLKAIASPLSHIPMVAVGNVNIDNFKDYLGAGMTGVGIGSNIVKESFVVQKDYNKIKELARNFTCQI